MSSKYKSVKHPCKICFQSVKPKNGLKCTGACEAWVHYQCLNYTPGKIYDIKKGLIEVTCPCPDCDAEKPQQYDTNEVYSVQNVTCGNDESQPLHLRNIRPIPLVSTESITECFNYDNEYMQQVQGEVLHTNQMVPVAGQPKTDGIRLSCIPKSQADVVVPNNENLMEQIMGVISELSQRLQGLLMQIQRNPGVTPPNATPLLLPSYIKSTELNPAVVEWKCDEPRCIAMRNSKTTTIQNVDFMTSQWNPTVVNHYGVYDQQSKQPPPTNMVNKNGFYLEPRVYRQ